MSEANPTRKPITEGNHWKFTTNGSGWSHRLLWCFCIPLFWVGRCISKGSVLMKDRDLKP